MDKKLEGPLRRQVYWEGELEDAYETSADPSRAAFGVFYRWIVAETKHRRAGEAGKIADYLLQQLLEKMEETAKAFINIDCRDDLN